MATYMNYQLTGQPIREVNEMALHMEDDEVESNWRDQAERLQSRRWKKIMKNS